MHLSSLILYMCNPTTIYVWQTVSFITLSNDVLVEGTTVPYLKYYHLLINHIIFIRQDRTTQLANSNLNSTTQFLLFRIHFLILIYIYIYSTTHFIITV